MNNRAILYIFLFFIITLEICTQSASSQVYERPDTCKTIETSKLHGYSIEEHTVMTGDNYALTLHRIVNPAVSKKMLGRPYVLLHGLLGTSGGWVTNINPSFKAHYQNTSEMFYNTMPKLAIKKLSDEKAMMAIVNNVTVSGEKISSSLAFSLANHGYDVWLANLRGNEYSWKNPQSPSFAEYWKFDVDDVAKYDLTGIFEYVKNKTEISTMGVVSYSVSSLTLMRMLKLFPLYALSLRPIILMAPTVFSGERDSVQKKALKMFDKYLAERDGPFPEMENGIAKSFFSKLKLFISSNPVMSPQSKLFVQDFSCGRTSRAFMKHLLNNMITSQQEINKFIDVPSEIRPRLRRGEVMHKTIMIVHSAKDGISTNEEVSQLRGALKEMVLTNYRIDGRFDHNDFLFDPRNHQLVNIPIVRMAIAFDFMTKILDE
ncbi:SPBC14C8.15 [Fragariocoptes setiger]|uniref:SPBC14C8.15 n=1 Tax=Fragariocoptes setiger TaxID=1670756 RepID=A0ABQ7SCT4_9ACAR|nr:SPBC14C8.15 [Fragariocoptes setiger]